MSTDPLPHAAALAALMQRVGFAVWQLQELETAVATYVVVRLKAARGMGREQAAGLEAAAGRKTFGALLRDLLDSGVLRTELKAGLEAMLPERNWLMHRARRDSRGVLASPTLYDALSDRLDLIASNALTCLKAVGVEVEAYVTSNGVDQATIDRDTSRLMDAWGLGDL